MINSFKFIQYRDNLLIDYTRKLIYSFLSNIRQFEKTMALLEELQDVYGMYVT